MVEFVLGCVFEGLGLGGRAVGVVVELLNYLFAHHELVNFGVEVAVSIVVLIF